MLKLLHTVSGIWTSTGGPAESVPRLCASLARAGAEITIATLRGPLSAATLEAAADGVRIETYSHIHSVSLSIFNGIRALSQEVDLIHGHGLWLPTNWATGAAARKTGKPFVLSPKGTLNPAALRHSRAKKKLAAALSDHRDLKSAHCLQASSETEYRAIRSYGLGNPVAVIPHGIVTDVFDRLPDPTAFRLKLAIPPEKRILLFVSRLSWEKGLEDLAKAWGNVAGEFTDWVLMIVGAGDRAYVAKLRALFRDQPGADRVAWTGMLMGDEKLAAYAAAALFILPSYTENFSLVVAEALASRLPVITTRGTPWAELEARQCGWWVPTGAAGLTTALREALQLPESRRIEMGSNGRALISERYSWGRIATEMLAVYAWLLGGGPAPPCVMLH